MVTGFDGAKARYSCMTCRGSHCRNEKATKAGISWDVVENVVRLDAARSCLRCIHGNMTADWLAPQERDHNLDLSNHLLIPSRS